MSEKNLKSLRFHGLDDIYKIPSTAEDVGAATPEAVNSAKTAAINESKTYTDAAVQKARPRNLLINSDFINPVNQRGQQNYTGSGGRDVYTIDRWYFGWQDGATLTVSPDGYIQKSAHEFTQAIENVDLTKTYTGAICLKDGTKYVYSGKVDNGFGDWGNTIWVWTNNGRIYFGIHSGITQPIAWAALYEGEYTLDTLPEYQSKGYENELLVCRQYDPVTGEYIGLRKFGQPRNLLDNSYFPKVSVVNQRGQDSYSLGKWGGYHIDRWYAGSDGANITFHEDGIHLTNTIVQPIDNPSRLADKVVTIAAKINGKVWCGSGTVKYANTWSRVIFVVQDSFKIGLETGNENNLSVTICCDSQGVVEWAALYEGEYTLDTLPEYQPKGYGAELAECMRYYQSYGAGLVLYYSGTNFTLTFPYKTEMRITPPTVTLTTNNILIYGLGGATAADITVSNFTKLVHSVSPDGAAVIVLSGTPNTTITPGAYRANQLTDYITFSADL